MFTQLRRNWKIIKLNGFEVTPSTLFRTKHNGGQFSPLPQFSNVDFTKTRSFQKSPNEILIPPSDFPTVPQCGEVMGQYSAVRTGTGTGTGCYEIISHISAWP